MVEMIGILCFTLKRVHVTICSCLAWVHSHHASTLLLPGRSWPWPLHRWSASSAAGHWPHARLCRPQLPFVGPGGAAVVLRGCRVRAVGQAMCGAKLTLWQSPSGHRGAHLTAQFTYPLSHCLPRLSRSTAISPPLP